MEESQPVKQPVWSDLASDAFTRQFKVAAGYGSSLEPEHLLIALADLGSSSAHEIFETAGVTGAEVKAQAQAALPAKPAMHSLNAEAPSERWRNITTALFAEFPELPTVGTGHLLYAVVKALEKSDKPNVALLYLTGKGLSSEVIKSQVDISPEPATREFPNYDKSKLPVNGETPWGRSYEIEPKHNLRESKFQTGEATISLAEIAAAWPKWTDKEKVDFTNNYNCISTQKLRDEDQRVIHYLIEHASPDDRMLLSWMLGHFYKDRDEAFAVLARWVRDPETSNKASFFESLATLNATAALPILRECHDGLLKNVDLDHFSGGDKAIWEQPAPYQEIAIATGVLYKLTEEATYRTILEKLTKHPDKSVNLTAARDLKEVVERG